MPLICCKKFCVDVRHCCMSCTNGNDNNGKQFSLLLEIILLFQYVEPVSLSSGNAFISRAGRCEIQISVCQIGHNAANSSPPLHISSKWAVLTIKAQWRGNGSRKLVSRFGLDTAGKMKDLLDFFMWIRTYCLGISQRSEFQRPANCNI